MLDPDIISQNAAQYCKSGLSCSESTVKALGEAMLDDFSEILIKAASPFSGGIGGPELCGALSGGLMIIGALYGRTSAAESRAFCRAVSIAFREAFLERFGETRCHILKSDGWGAEEHPCSSLVGESSRILLTILENPPEVPGT